MLFMTHQTFESPEAARTKQTLKCNLLTTKLSSTKIGLLRHQKEIMQRKMQIRMIFSRKRQSKKRFKLNIDEDFDIQIIEGMARELISNQMIKHCLVSFVSHVSFVGIKMTKCKRTTFYPYNITPLKLAWIVSLPPMSVGTLTYLFQEQSNMF